MWLVSTDAPCTCFGTLRCDLTEPVQSGPGKLGLGHAATMPVSIQSLPWRRNALTGPLTVSVGMPVCPFPLLPQQTGVPPALIAHVWPQPALIWLTVPIPAGMCVCPDTLSPQQTGVPSALIAHVKRAPALIWLTVPIPAGMCVCPDSLRPQQTGVP